MTPMLSDFKNELARKLKIIAWKPSAEDLETIACRVAELESDLRADLVSIVNDVCAVRPLFLCEEGEDSSDLRTLLTLARLMAKKG